LTIPCTRHEHREVFLFLALLLAAGPVHRARAEHAEALGHMREAAREYEAAYSESHEPDLLYRLGIVRRKLKQYGRAREAFRAYLRVAPEGGLREEVQRQLVKLEVLVEAQSEDFSSEPEAAPRAGEQRSLSPAASGEQRSLPPAAPVTPPPAAAPSALSGEQRSPALSDEVNGVHQNPRDVPPPPAIAAPPGPILSPPMPAIAPPPSAAPPAALPGEQRSPALSREVNSVHHFGPWLAGGAAVAAAAGAYFWWDGARLSNALDTRFAQGGLQPKDQPLYGRANGASIAGRALVAAGAALAVGAVILW
jgi:tetratricopeptide (TPR) repeat protein